MLFSNGRDYTQLAGNQSSPFEPVIPIMRYVGKCPWKSCKGQYATWFCCKMLEYLDIELQQIAVKETNDTWQSFYIINPKESPCAVIVSVTSSLILFVLDVNYLHSTE